MVQASPAISGRDHARVQTSPGVDRTASAPRSVAYTQLMSFVGRRARTHAVVGAVAVLCLLAALALPGAASAARPLIRGFADDVWSGATGSQWASRAAGSGARRALVVVNWRGIEPTAPPTGKDPTDPAGSELHFGSIDAAVRQLVGAGIQPALLVTEAPSWAQAPGGPRALEQAGAWKPNATALGQFAAALARRYSGSYPDPLGLGQTLPRVRYYQAWAEANFSIHLAPQWVRSGGHLVAYAPAMYRSMLNAFAAGVKSARSSNLVITSGFGPYGGVPSLSVNARTPPAQFARELLCLNGRSALSPARCPNPAHFDAIASDPYEVGSPATLALNPDDVSAPDLGKLTRIVSKAVRAGRALPRHSKQLWVTEFSYDSRPPNPTALSLATQARWLEESLYVFWTERVTAMFWYLIRDQSATFNAADYYSGIYFFNGTAKPSRQAYSFPLVVMGSTAWGISPRRGTVSVQHRQGGAWKTLFTATASAGGVFTRAVSASLRGDFRAVVGGRSSLVWRR